MLDSLAYLGNRVVGRYKTVESNIRNRSNSFYDSFLDLLEDTLKEILMREDIGYRGRTCGEILREPDVNNLFKHTLKVSSDTYAKVGDYVKKINEHKHNNEKYINVDTVINYMRVYCDFVGYYLKSKEVEVAPFNETFYKGIYGVTLERSKELDNVTQKVDEYVSATNVRFDEQEDRIAQLEKWSAAFGKRIMQPSSQPAVSQPKRDNGATEKEAMQWFFKTSRKSLRWLGNQKELNKQKTLAIFSHVLLIVLGIVSSVITTMSLRIYSTFTLFENVWLIFTILMLVYASKAKLKYVSSDLAKNTRSKCTQDQYGLWNPGKPKLVFKIFKWICLISVICNISFIWFRQSNLSVVATVFEVLFFGAIFFSLFRDVCVFAQYTIVYLEGLNMITKEKMTLVWDPMIKKLIPEEEYKKQIPFLFDDKF